MELQHVGAAAESGLGETSQAGTTRKWGEEMRARPSQLEQPDRALNQWRSMIATWCFFIRSCHGLRLLGAERHGAQRNRISPQKSFSPFYELGEEGRGLAQESGAHREQHQGSDGLAPELAGRGQMGWSGRESSGPRGPATRACAGSRRWDRARRCLSRCAGRPRRTTSRNTSLLRSSKVAEVLGVGGARGHTRRRLAAFDPGQTEIALVYLLRGRVDVARIVRASGDAEGAADAQVLVDPDDAVGSLGGSSRGGTRRRRGDGRTGCTGRREIRK